ncbi:VanW family protein [Paenibacillus sedimenti]|uniref:VanW family protein n=1 Tax=Paenibacillus sedimenti TaxID=2770274 RepID=A0A926QLY9_9BACL|nr:VanW family protein [Paenibacillus sedimenti]MBD0384145.1 VanW family protein [Paenibacillus sedimenti]
MPPTSPILSHTRKYLLILSFIVVLSGAGWGALYAYGTGQKLPAHFQVAGWKAGGLTHTQFLRQLDEQLKVYNSLKVHLASPSSEIRSKDLTLAELGLVIDREELDEAIQKMFHASVINRIAARWSLRNAQLPLRMSIDPDKLNAAVRQRWKELYDRQPVAARRVVNPDDSIRYEPERTVPRLDTITLQKELESGIPPVTGLFSGLGPLKLAIPIYIEQPSVTVDSLKKQGVERKIAEFATSFPLSGTGRIHNIRSTATSIQDMLLAPGETFDYSKIIERTEAQFGYQEAPVILNGKLVPGIGGGICQVSSTLYNAVLRSGLEIIERRNHSLPVSYVPLGQDATFASGYINFKFRNNTGAYLLIRAVTTDRDVTVKLFGRSPSTDTYDIESKIIEKIQPTIKYLHNPALRSGSTKPITQGKEGYIVETYRYKKVNGIVVSKELVSKDRYAAVPTLVASNLGDIKPDEGNQGENNSQILEDGVKGPSFR